MICKQGGPKDRDALISLWRRVFGDEEDAIAGFLADSGAHTLCGYEGETLAAMLYLLPVTVTGSPKRRGYYLYAAATEPAFRNGGRMTSLLSFAAEYTRKTGRDSIFLLPADEGLRDYYAARGYRTVSGVEECFFPAAPKTSPLPRCEEADFLRLRRHYLAGFPAAFCPEQPFDAFFCRHTRREGGEILLLSQKSADGALQSYAICYTMDREVFVEETSLPPAAYAAGAALISGSLGGLPVRIRKAGTHPFGMSLSCDGRQLPPVYMNGLME